MDNKVKEGLYGLLEGLKLSREDLFLGQLTAAWPEICGPLARKSQPLRILGDTLHVRVESAVHAQEIMLHKGEIIRRIERDCKFKIRRIYTETGEVTKIGMEKKVVTKQSEPLSEGEKLLLEALRHK